MSAINESNRKWWTLVGACLGLFLLMLDSTVVTLALPPIQRELGSSDSELQWMLNGYLLTLAVLVVTGGRLGDIFGRKKIFLISMAVFFVGSVTAAIAPTSEVLILARIVQGAGGAGLITLSLAIVSHAFPVEEQARALGIWAGVSALALAIGPLVGGALIESFSWRWIFWLNVPFIVFGTVVTYLAAPESYDRSSGSKIDLWGLLTLTVGITGVVLALIQSKSWGIVSAPTLLSFSIGLLSLSVFWHIEHRVKSPIVEFPLFKNRPYLGANAAAFGIVFCFWVIMFFMPQYFQNILGYGAFISGCLILPTVVPMIFISPLGGKLIEKFGKRAVMTTGLGLALIGVIGLLQISSTSTYWTVFPFLLLFGVAIAMVYAPMSSAAMSAMPREKAGIASGVLAMNRMMSGAIGLAVIGGLFGHLEQNKRSDVLTGSQYSLSSNQVKDLDGLLAGSDGARRALTDQSPAGIQHVEGALRETFTFALANVMWVLIGVAALSMLLTWIYLAEKRASEDEEEEEALEHRHSFRHRTFHF